MQKIGKLSIYLVLVLVFGIMIVRLFQLNVIDNNYYEEQMYNKKNKIITLESAPRGRILDRNGNILVDNVGIKNIVYTKVNGITTKEEIEIAKELATLINMEYKESTREYKDYYIITHEDEVKNLITDEEYDKLQNRKLTSNDIYNLKLERITDEMLKTQENEKLVAHIYALMNSGYKYALKTILENASEDVYAKVIEKNIKGVTGCISWQRTYPYGEVLRQIFGRVSSSESGIPKDKKEEYLKLGYDLNDRVGISYLESYYEEYLKGTKAKYKVNDDNTLSLISEEKRGNDLVLSIDINMQLELEQVLMEQMKKDKHLANTEYYDHSYVIVSEPNTGAIVAMIGKRLNENSEDFSNIYTNIINSNYTMGSVVKGASQTVGYQNNLIDPNEYITDSCVKLHLVPEKCSFKRLGRLNDISALKWSSNYYQFITAIKSTGKTYSYNMQLNATADDFKRYRDTFDSFGLGVLTDIDLSEEQTGFKGTKVADDLLLNLSIGQYDTYTPIELVQYINTIATNGKRTSLRLMQKIVDENDNVIIENKGNVLNQVNLSEEYFNRIKEGFRAVMDGGTGAGYTDLKYNPAGKTGTSQSFYDSDNDGVVDVETTSMSYAMFAPYDNPRYSLVIVSPHVSHKNGSSDYMAYINSHISKEVSKILFEKY